MGNQIDDEAPELDNPQDTPEAKAERYKQIIAGKEKQAKDAENARLLEKAARQVLANPDKLVDLPEDIGKEVVAMLYAEGNATTDDYESLLSGLKKPAKNELDEDELFRKMEEKREQKQSKTLVTEWVSKYPAEKQDELLEEFQDMAGDRVLDTTKTKKIIDRIEAYYRKNELEEERKDMAYATFASSNVKQRSTTTTGPKKSTVNAAKWLGMSDREMKELGII